ncbi:MAG: hypothetical protein RIM84_03400, partial [Alphaproteobacteria bacterium]
PESAIWPIWPPASFQTAPQSEISTIRRSDRPGHHLRSTPGVFAQPRPVGDTTFIRLVMAGLRPA